MSISIRSVRRIGNGRNSTQVSANNFQLSPKENAMRFDTYLFFNGQCEEAFKFYEQCFGGKIEAMLPHEGTPAAEHVPADWQKKIMHARLTIGDSVLMASDVHTER